MLIKRKLAPHLLGHDPLAGERLWDVLYRQDRHARKGYEMMAISAVDNALWDLRGKLLNLPVYRTYAVRLLERIAEYRPRWLEEPVPPDRLNDFVAIRKASRVPIATGEHEYTRWGFLQLLQAEAIDVLQADPDWCGGISELVKICTLASAYGKPVIPHGHSVPAAVHVIAATPPATCPLAEFLVRNQPAAQHFHTRFVHPEGGAIPLPDVPGLGLEIDESKVDERREL